MRIGTNVTHIAPQAAVDLGCEHLEVSLLWHQDLELAERVTVERIQACESTGVNYSIHLPIYTRSYPYHVFSAYFLDEDSLRREASFKMVADNLEALSAFKPEFFVLHFSGIYPKVAAEVATERLHLALARLDDLAAKHGTRLVLEYFGFNENMLGATQWQPILDYPHLGVLLDTGHMLFSARMHGMNFPSLLRDFLPLTAAVHVWNTQQEPGVYEEAPSYMAFHHLVPRHHQRLENGYGIDMPWLYALLRELPGTVPIVIEASIRHASSGTLEDGILEWLTWPEDSKTGASEK